MKVILVILLGVLMGCTPLTALDDELDKTKSACEKFCSPVDVSSFQWQKCKGLDCQLAYYYACYCDDGSELGHWSQPRAH